LNIFLMNNGSHPGWLTDRRLGNNDPRPKLNWAPTGKAMGSVGS
jgi:hypothetical protein